MSTSESLAEVATDRANIDLTHAGMGLPDEALRRLRMDLYHSNGPGYCVLKQFIQPAAAHFMRRLWATVEPSASHQPFPGKTHIYRGCPDYCVLDAEGNRTFYNFLWNAPLDELTAEVSMHVQVLRNRVSGRGPYVEVLGEAPKAVCYRVVVTRNARTWIQPHRDYLDYDCRFEKNRYDLSRLQATLYLSEKGVDYDGTGFRLELNGGRSSVVFGTDVDVAPGDLVLWRYNNLHSVEDVRSAAGQLGFVRVVFPLEDVLPAPVSDSVGSGGLAARLRAVVGKLTGG